MHLREFQSNIPEAINHLESEDRTDSPLSKILGISWQKDRDQLILSQLASVFDPLGLIAPSLLTAKLFFQSLWKLGVGWDDWLDNETANDWMKVGQAWGETVEIPRCISIGGQRTLHTFCDASEKAIAVCVYSKEIADSQFVTSLIFAKVRVVPEKTVTKTPNIYRLELVAAVEAVKALNFVRKHLNLCKKLAFIWTDSGTVISWLRNNAEKHEVFVKNRVTQIQNCPSICVKYVASNDNPADIGSRGLTATHFRQEKKWWNGPEFLQKAEEEWPSNPQIPDFWPGAVKLWLKSWKRQNIPFKISSAAVSPTEKEEQSLDIFSDDQGILRAKTRLQYSGLPKNAIEPIWLPLKAHLTSLIVLDVHTQLMHGGPMLVLSHLRKTYWLPKGRKTVLKVLKKSCLICRKFTVQPFSLPKYPAFPAPRVLPNPPFSCTGVDYLGPVNLKTEIGSRKAWIALFTCLSTRAMHLELVFELSADKFLGALKRFIGRRGTPRLIISDNGTQFKLSAKAIELIWCQNWDKIFQSQEVLNYSSSQGIRWHFIIERAPWKGGFYERLVAMVKHHLRRTLGRSALTADVFETILVQVEAIVNSRPITFLSHDQTFPQPLSPSDFLMPLKGGVPPTELADSEYTPQKSTPETLLELWEKQLQALNNFWCQWSADYLLSLKERYQKITQSRPVPKVGEVVLVWQEEMPRGLWRYAVITALLKNSDQAVSDAEIRFANGRTSRRSIGHLFPLETSEEFENRAVEHDHQTVQPTSSGQSSGTQNSSPLAGKTVIAFSCVNGWGWSGSPPNGRSSGITGFLKKVFPWFVIVGTDVATDLALKNPPPAPSLPIAIPQPTETPNHLFDADITQQQLNADETMLEYRQPSSNYSSVSSVSPEKELMDLQDGQVTQPVDNTEHQAAAALPSHQINTLHYPPTSAVTLNQESLKSKRVYQYKGKKRKITGLEEAAITGCNIRLH
uniref:Integrase catalytic domain-containing protein n=1 Tax=Ditylenchus dipsaci TaxID=166011 RepID=A0A915DCU7_9BILA